MRAAVTTAMMVTLAGAAACRDADDLRERVRAAGVFSPVRVDVGNPKLVTLGQMLFFDPELSGNRNMACATCHLPERHSSDGRRIARGQDDARMSRSSPALFNRGGDDAFFWDGRLERDAVGIHGPVPLPPGLSSLIEAQALLPLLDRGEMRGHPNDLAIDGRANELGQLADDANHTVWTAVMARLLVFDGYRELFAAAYPTTQPSDLTIVHVARAIAAFEQRLWELNDTPFDQWLGSIGVEPDTRAMDPGALRGAALFFGDAGCVRCHNGPLLSDGQFHAIAVPQIGPGRDERHADLGRYEVTLDAADRFAFRTPPLRNVELTPPYMHDGAYDDLESAVRHHLDPAAALASYDVSLLPADLRTQRHVELDDELLAALDPLTRPRRPLGNDEIQELLMFLRQLSSRTEAELPESPAVPTSVPSGLPLALPDTSDHF